MVLFTFIRIGIRNDKTILKIKYFILWAFPSLSTPIASRGGIGKGIRSMGNYKKQGWSFISY